MSDNLPTLEQVEAVLNGIVDPCSAAAGRPLGLVDMGLITDLTVNTIAPDAVRVRARVRVTEPGCLMGSVFIAEARKRLQALAGVGEIELEHSSDFDWHPTDVRPQARMPPEARQSIERHLKFTSLAFLDRCPIDRDGTAN